MKSLILPFLLCTCFKYSSAQIYIQVPKDFAKRVLTAMPVYVQLDSNRFFIDTQYTRLYPEEMLLNNPKLWVDVDTTTLVIYNAGDTALLDSILGSK